MFNNTSYYFYYKTLFDIFYYDLLFTITYIDPRLHGGRQKPQNITCCGP